MLLIALNKRAIYLLHILIEAQLFSKIHVFCGEESF